MSKKITMSSPFGFQRTFIDVFCGCGGFSLGMTRAGFRCLAAIDSNAEAIHTFEKNFEGVPNILQEDLTKYPPAKLAARIGDERVDVIVGGPPCQGFSNVRQVDAANHGSRVKRDKRRYFYRLFFDYVRYFQPQVFVMENVLGIQSAVKGKIFTRVQAEARLLGYRVHPQVEEAWKLGVPQKRRRQLIIGVRVDVRGFFPSALRPCPRAGGTKAPPTPTDMLSLIGDHPAPSSLSTTLWDAIGDLPPLEADGGEQESEYDFVQRRGFLANRGERARRYLEDVVEIGRATSLTAHRARPQSARDLRDFSRLREGEHSAQAIARGEAMDFPYNRDCFHDRYKRQHREELCSTIVAHLSKDGLMFIHPTQLRSLTPREAARVQSFPDWFTFPVTRTHQFRLIGNAVPPLVGEAVGQELMKFLNESARPRSRSQFWATRLPGSEAEALAWLLPLLDKDRYLLRRVSGEAFRQAWFSIAFLFADLHPDGALDHGKTFSHSGGNRPLISSTEPRLLAPFYERSGWPVVLNQVTAEAWRRYRIGRLGESEFYCAEAQAAGIDACGLWPSDPHGFGHSQRAA